MSALNDQLSPVAEHDGAQLMLAELNHRVGNELMAALSALRLARRNLLESTAPERYLDEAVSRLESFGWLHEILDPNRCHGTLCERLELLCRATSASKGALSGVHIVLFADDVAVDAHTAWILCVVASELITNAIKHAFPDDILGIVAVELREEAAGLVLTVADNGSGICPNGPKGLGSGILAQLAASVGGSITRWRRTTGTAVTLKVPIERMIQ